MPPVMLPFLQQSPFTLRICYCCPYFSLCFLRSLSSNSASSSVTNLSSLLQGRFSPSHLLQVHAQVYKTNVNQDNLIATRLIGHYPPRFALRVFNQLQKPNIFPFNAIIRVLSEDGLFFESFLIFKVLKQRALSPSDFTFSFLLKACSRSNDAQYVKQTHTQIIKLGYLCDSSVCHGLLSAYGKGPRDLVSARKVFDAMPDKDVVCCWTSLIAGCAQSGQAEEVLQLFCTMVEQSLRPEDDTMVSVLSACSNLDIVQMERWVLILSEFVNNIDLKELACDSINTILVYLYGKWGKIEKSRERFNEINLNGKRSVLPWNAMLGAYVQNGCPMEALSLFRLMLEDGNHRPNHVTMVAVLSACGQIGDLDLGRWVHQSMKSVGRGGILETNRFLATALIDMYLKCGILECAKEVFNQMVSKDVVSFNAMIMGLATNGEGEEAVSLFSRMQEYGLHPNAGTFLGLLYACSHSGLSEKGRQIFIDMNLRFSVAPKLEHYACYIDLLAREGLIQEALDVAASMPFEPNNFVWGALLGGCLLHSRLDLAENVYRRLVELDPENSGVYVMLANAYAVDHRWSEVSILRWLMRDKRVKKQPGCSWISIDGIVHEFLVGSTSHPQNEGMVNTLNGLANVMKVAGS